MAIVHAQVRFSTPAGVMVNTFAFNNSTTPTYDTHAAEASTAIANFYTSAGAASVGSNMSGWISRNVEVRCYDPNQPPIRTPTITNFTLPACTSPASQWTVPSDVAMVLSYHAGPPISRRRRGRIYLPGASSNWFTAGTTSSLPTWNLGGAGTQAFAVNLAATALSASAVGWCIFSRAGNGYYKIVGGYIDSEPDTQRRRGSESTTRVTWGT